MIIERAMPLGGSVTIDGEDVTNELALLSYDVGIYSVLDMPSTPLKGNILYQGEKIYMLCEYAESSSTKYDRFYMYKDGVWTQLPNTPQSGYYNSRIALVENEVHFMWSYYHYKWDGEAWIELERLPRDIRYTNVVEYHGELYLLDSSQMSNSNTIFYKWDGEAWLQVGNLPENSGYYDCGRAVVYDDCIYYLRANRAYKYCNGEWSGAISGVVNEVSELSTVLVYNNKLYAGGSNSSSTHSKYSIYDGTTMTVEESPSGQIYGMLDVEGELWIATMNKFWTERKIYYKKGWYLS